MNLLIILALIAVYQNVTTERAEAEAAALAAAQAEMQEQKAAAGTAAVYNDGTYTGSAQGYGGPVEVEVVIENDVITEINALSHSGEGAAYWDMASDMIPAMLSAQSPNVDTVTGATFTSTGLHNAVTAALKSAVRE